MGGAGPNLGGLQLDEDEEGSEGGTEITHIPSRMLCSKSSKLMLDPAILTDGNYYEYSVAKEWLDSHDTSPLSGKKLDNKIIIRVPKLRNEILEFRKTRVTDILSALPNFLEDKNFEQAEKCFPFVITLI